MPVTCTCGSNRAARPRARWPSGWDACSEQRAQLRRRRAELEAELASGDAPILQAQARLNETLALRLTVEGELAVAREALEAAEEALRGLDEERLAAEQRVHAAREAMEQARLAAQETHVRRAALAEQFAETRCELRRGAGRPRRRGRMSSSWEQALPRRARTSRSSAR